MCQVDWFYQALYTLDLSSARVLMALLNSSYRGVSAGGSPVLLSRFSLPSLSSTTSLPRRSVQRGLDRLAAIHLVKPHRSTSPSGATVYEFPLMLPPSFFKELRRQRGGDNLSPPRQRGLANLSPPLTTHGGGGVSPCLETGGVNTSTMETGVLGGETPVAGDNLAPLAQLKALGFRDPEAFIAQHPAQRIAKALEVLASTNPGEIRKPAAFIRHIVEVPGPITDAGQNYVMAQRQQQRERALRRTMCRHTPFPGLICPNPRRDSCESPQDCPLNQRIIAIREETVQ